MSNLAEGMLPGHWAVLMLLPFVMLGVGLWFIGRAFSDKVDARPPDPRVVPLPDRKDRPLYHVHLQIRASARRPASRTDEPDEPDERGSSGRPRRSTRDGPKLVVHR
ncbi:MAG TPA: hypothetical protein VGM21_20335 [Actinomycetota bacterium]|jgi:hypothetical protein